ncbi:MAG: hypothetical protein A2Y79_02240 [Deltaproteobacteria bacterium RBG_13_43_22]|nr:MAG: hypothetical protein A2Y79_02240 [Deltaproteobacteria bacterium RBG_13_43_22]
MQTPPNSWLPLEEFRITPEGRWETRGRFGSHSEWFSGHFDECPLVPGVALLSLAVETVIRQALGTERILKISGFSRVRFKHLVFPDEELVISVAAMTQDPKAELDFYLTCHGEPVVQGLLKVTEEICF